MADIGQFFVLASPPALMREYPKSGKRQYQYKKLPNVSVILS